MLGLTDAMGGGEQIRVFGPSRGRGEARGSKVFMKRLLARANAPTAAFEVFDDVTRADDYVRTANRPLVVKADGLAGGKGVHRRRNERRSVCRARQDDEAKTIPVMPGERSSSEELLPGGEASFHVVCDRRRGVVLSPAQDHKRVADGDRGANTGGMGAYAPAPVVTAELETCIMRTIIDPVLATMESEGTPFRGALFAGLMIDGGVPRVLEFNVRFGDPGDGGDRTDLFG